MKKTELRKLIKKNILPSLNNFSFHKDVLIKPINSSILRSFGFEISSFGKVAIIAFFQPLYLNKENFVWTFGNRIRDRDNKEWWDLENEENVSHLINILKVIDAKMLSKVRTPLDLYDLFNSSEEKGLRYEEFLLFTACKANLDITDSLLKKQIKRIENEGVDFDWVIALKERYQLFLNLNKEDRQLKLEEWEKETIHNLKLENCP